MVRWLRRGWEVALRHPWIISMLFIYQLAGGFALYLFVQSITLPLLDRYPGKEFSESAVELFMAEAQFQLLKTDIAHSYVWIFALMILLRMVMTPFINAGIYHSIHVDEVRQIRPFMEGVRAKGMTFSLLYLVQLTMTLLPMIGCVPYIQKQITSHSSIEGLVFAMLPLLIGYGLYVGLIRLCFIYLQWSRVTGSSSILHALLLFISNIVPIFGLSLILFAILAMITVISSVLTIVWAGFIMFIVHQLFYLVKTLFRLWEISSHYALWQEKVAGD